MADWSDQQLSGHKRAQGYISSTGATLGIAALGAASLKSKSARKVLRRLPGKAGDNAVRGAKKAGKYTQPLTVGSAGVGGIGGYNFAAIQSQEAKRAKVGKNMSESVWGVDHGAVEVGKAISFRPRVPKGRRLANNSVARRKPDLTLGQKKAAIFGGAAGAAVAGGVAGGVAGDKVSKADKVDRKALRQQGNVFGRGISMGDRKDRYNKNTKVYRSQMKGDVKGFGAGLGAGGAAGAAAGLGASAITRGRLLPGKAAAAGAGVGGFTGAMTGETAGANNGWKKGVKSQYPSAIKKDVWGVDHGEVAKGWDDLDRKTKDKVFASTVSGPYQGFTRGKKGKKVRAAGNIAGRGIAGSLIGGAPGVALSAATKGRASSAGNTLASLGSTAGGVAGVMSGVEANHRRGHYKKKP